VTGYIFTWEFRGQVHETPSVKVGLRVLFKLPSLNKHAQSVARFSVIWRSGPYWRGGSLCVSLGTNRLTIQVNCRQISANATVEREPHVRRAGFTEMWFLDGVRRGEQLYSRSRIHPLPAKRFHPLRPCVAEYFGVFLRHIGIDGGLCPWIVEPD
jgi:hypothetical protein